MPLRLVPLYLDTWFSFWPPGTKDNDDELMVPNNNNNNNSNNNNPHSYENNILLGKEKTLVYMYVVIKFKHSSWLL